MHRKFSTLLIQYLAGRFLKALTAQDVLTITNRGWFLEGKKLTPELVQVIKEEAHAFEQSLLWDVMKRDIEYQAFVKGRKALTDRENDACHYMFYNLDIIKKYLDSCRRL